MIMGKPIQQKPPYFKECPICHREFGSRSLEIHKSRCLERQKSTSDQVRWIPTSYSYYILFISIDPNLDS